MHGWNSLELNHEINALVSSWHNNMVEEFIYKKEVVRLCKELSGERVFNHQFVENNDVSKHFLLRIVTVGTFKQNLLNERQSQRFRHWQRILLDISLNVRNMLVLQLLCMHVTRLSELM